jgi:3-oxoacyl-[acyl-carrier protein] reductase
MRLENKVAIITGGASGIGLETARIFAREGAQVAIADLNVDGAEAAAKSLPGSGHLGFGCNVTDSARVDKVVAATIEAFGKVDVLMNNAGVDKLPNDGFQEAIAAREFPVLHMTDEAFTQMMNIHVSGSLYFTRACVRSMMEAGGGSIINISSIAGLVGRGPVHYATAKGALLGMTKSLANQLGPAQIRVNAICPGVIDTPMTDGVPDEYLKPLIKQTPLRRKGSAADIANTALFLACDEGAFLTGQALSPNGGLVIT